MKTSKPVEEEIILKEPSDISIILFMDSVKITWKDTNEGEELSLIHI